MASDTITVTVDHEFSISLESIATAGYLWKIESLPDGIQFLESKNEKPTGDMKPGDSITQVFQFRAIKVGEYTITFVLARPWESKPIETRTVTVKAN